MDGQRLWRWCLTGGMLIPAVGCKHNSIPDSPGVVVNGPSTTAKKSLFDWGSSSTPNVSMMPSMVTSSSRRSVSKLQPDTEVQFANTHVEVALADPPPPNRDELLDMARQRYSRALKQDPKHQGALLGIARMYVKIGDRERAMEAYHNYQVIYPKDVEVLHELALAHAVWADWAGAVNWCEAALKGDPQNRAYRKTMGFCLARAGRWEEGYKTLCQIMSEPQARYNMARVLEHQNRPDASRQQLQLALQADPSYAPAKEFLAELDQSEPTGRTGVPVADPNPIRQVSGTSIPQ